ncbi:MAG: CDP-diacylglycerol--glycerol-3-phosphate 3-phosphatidyltransferase [Deltaproteobacteria bacterium]|nr:CDP-diacylglycerol--glycerol-3-phosphate 3-phosphatidyltransferase [Deltaproteobacteria bacterium]
MSWLEKRTRKPLTTDQLLGIANYLTYGRIAVVPIVLFLLSMIDDKNLGRQGMNYFLSWFCTSLTTAAGISDVIDGYYARRYGVVSSFGKFLDPLADKLLTMSVMIMMIPMGRLPAWIVIVLIARDVTITGLRSMAADEGLDLAASAWGKRKMAMHMVALGFLLVHYPTWGLDPHRIGIVLLWLTMLISLGSGFHYIWCFFGEVLVKQKSGGGS